MPSIRSSEMPAGRIIDYAGGPVPDGFLLCDGTGISTTQYSTLFAAIQYTYGGAGATFNLPDFRGRSTVASGLGAGLTNRSRGDTPGAEGVTLAASQIPSHTHSVGVTVGMTMPAGEGTHSHNIDPTNTSRTGSGTGRFSSGSDFTEPAGMTVDSTNSDHNHPIVPVVNVTEASIGGSAVHTNLQPSLVVTKIIKY